MRILIGLAMAAAGCGAPATGAVTGDRLLAVARSAHELVAIDLASGSVAARFPVGKGPHEVARSVDGRYAYVPNYGTYPASHAEPREGPPRWIREPSGTLSRIDLVSGNTQLWKLDGCGLPHDALVSPDDAVVWITCEDKVQERDASHGTLRRQWMTGRAGSHALLLSRDGTRLAVANSAGASVTLIRLADGVLKTFETGQASEGMALSEDGRRLFVLAAAADRLTVIDMVRQEKEASVALDTRFPISLAVPKGRNEIWVAGNQSNEILILDAASLQPRGRIPLATQPLGMTTDASGDRVFVSLPRRNEVAEIDVAQRREVRRLGGVMESDGLALAPVGAPQAGRAEKHRTVTASDGVVVHLYEYAPTGPEKGAPVLMFHQAGGDARGELGPVARRLANEGRRVFAADLRSGGDRFGAINATAAGYKAAQPGYCHVMPDLEAALDAMWRETGRRAVVVGSSYSGALVVKLAARHPDKIAGFASFSPAGGEAMTGCEAEPELAEMKMPGLAVRDPGAAARVPWVAESNRRWAAAGYPVTLIEVEGHGVSLLLPERSKGDVDGVWAAFRAFLAKVDR